MPKVKRIRVKITVEDSFTEALEKFRISTIGEVNPEGYNQYKHDPYPHVDDWTPGGGPSSTATHTFAGSFLTNPAGVTHYVKKGFDENHLVVEHVAQQLAHLAGVKTAQTHLVQKGGVPHLASELVPGAHHIETGHSLLAASKHENVRHAFAAHAWLANWDAAGKEHSNVVLDTHNDPHFIDFGGSLTRRAQGANKALGHGLPGELQTLKTHGQNPAAKLFQHVTHADIKIGVERISKIPDATIRHVVESNGLPGSTADALISRKNAMVAEYNKPPHEHAPYGLHEHGSSSLFVGQKNTPSSFHTHDSGSQSSTPSPATLLNVQGISDKAAMAPHEHHGLEAHTHGTPHGTGVAYTLTGTAGSIPHEHQITTMSHEHAPWGQHEHSLAGHSGLDTQETHYHVGSKVHLPGTIQGISAEEAIKGHVHHGLPEHTHMLVSNEHNDTWATASGTAGAVPHEHELSAVGSHSAVGFHTFDSATKHLGAEMMTTQAASTYHASQYAKYTALLTTAEIKAGSSYGGSSSSFNTYFRNGGTLANASDHIKHLVSAINKSPGLEHPLVLHRGISGTYGLTVAKDSKVGAEWVDPGFMGTSLTSHTAIAMSGQHSLLVLNTPQGYPAGWIRYSDEKEVLLKPKTRYVVTKVEKNGGAFKANGFGGTVVYGNVLPHTEAMMLAAAPGEKALYKMPKWKTFPTCPIGKPHCAGQYFDIPKHVYSHHVDKKQHIDLAKADELLKNNFTKIGSPSHTHDLTHYGLKPDGKYGSITIPVEHWHDKALNGQVWIPKSDPNSQTFKYSTHKHEPEYHVHPEDSVSHKHYGNYGSKTKAPMYMAYESGTKISNPGFSATHEHLPNGSVKKV
jgi:hypothetical protein